MSQVKNGERTPLFKAHINLGAKMVSFGGWEMPVQYASILEEVRVVRNMAGLFDVSHMGRTTIKGSKATEFLNKILSFEVSKLKENKARYCVICDVRGGIIDDCILYNVQMLPQVDSQYILVPNASNTQTVIDWMHSWIMPNDNVAINNITSSTAMLALQGPQSASILTKLSNQLLPKRFAIKNIKIDGVEIHLARTGYTGEDGFELIVPENYAAKIWDLLIENGAYPCGLGARDILRLEAGLPLHGSEISASHNPYEANLARFVDADREEYVAKEALTAIRNSKSNKVLVGFIVNGKRVARHGYSIIRNSKQIGQVTSGTFSPTLDMNIGMGYVPNVYSYEGCGFGVDIRGTLVEARVVSLPFYTRGGV